MLSRGGGGGVQILSIGREGTSCLGPVQGAGACFPGTVQGRRGTPVQALASGGYPNQASSMMKGGVGGGGWAWSVLRGCLGFT